LNGVFFLGGAGGDFGFLIYVFLLNLAKIFPVESIVTFGYITKLATQKKKKKKTPLILLLLIIQPPSQPPQLHACMQQTALIISSPFLGTFAAAFSSTMHMRNFLKCKKIISNPHTNYLLNL
jgi:hypothetical protein